MKNYNVKPLGAMIAALAMTGGSQYLHAQTDEPTDNTPRMEEVVVTGFARSIANSIDVKRDADTVIQAISAADLGGLPDVSIADALGRLTGVTVTRSGGQASTIQIRGMGEGFVFSTLNGREQVSPNGTRAMEFSQFPSELINSVAVYMSPKASLVEGGVAGTVELRTANPLDMAEGQRFQIGVRGSYNDQASEIYGAEPFGQRLSFSYQKKLFDDALGLSLGYAKLIQPRAAAQFEHYNYQDSQLSGGVDVRLSDGFQMMQNGGEETRDGYMAAIQFEPVDSLSIQSDIFYSEFESESFNRGFRIQPLSGADSTNEVLWNNHVIGGEFAIPENAPTALNIQVANDNASENYDLLSGGLNVEWRQDALTVSADLSHSEASGFKLDGLTRSHLYTESTDLVANPSGWVREDDQQVRYLLDGINIPNVAMSADYTDLSALRMSTYERYPRINEDTVDAVRLDVEYELEMPLIRSFEIGVRYSERNHQEQRQVFVYGDGAAGMIETDYSLPITDATSEVVNWEGDFAHFPSFLAIDGQAIIEQAVADGLVLMSRNSFSGNVDDPNGEFNPEAFNSFNNLRPRSIEPAARWSEGRAWSMRERANIQEDVLAYYLMANLETELFGIEVTGNIGVRRIDSDQSNLAMVVADDPADAVTICDEVGDCRTDLTYQRIGTTYSNTLPSLNLNFHLTDSDQLRFAAARVLSRPPINKLATFVEGSINPNDLDGPTYNYGSSTSPFLTPFIADQIDVSYEHYMDETNGSFVIAAYHREIKSFIQDGSIENFDFEANGFDIPETTPVLDPGGVLTEAPVLNGTYTFAINNDEGGFIRGLELAYTQTFNFLPEPLSGLGISSSISLTDSEITIENPLSATNASLPFPGLVEESGKLTVFYSLGNFETRLSGTYQGSFVGDERNIELNPVIYAPETVLDYQASYAFNNGLDLVFSISNLTNEPNRSYMLDEQLTRKLQWFGRTFYLGANYSF